MSEESLRLKLKIFNRNEEKKTKRKTETKPSPNTEPSVCVCVLCMLGIKITDSQHGFASSIFSFFHLLSLCSFISKSLELTWTFVSQSQRAYMTFNRISQHKMTDLLNSTSCLKNNTSTHTRIGNEEIGNMLLAKGDT